MKKKIILRSISGVPLGLAIGYLITIVISLIWANLLCGILGMGFGVISAFLL